VRDGLVLRLPDPVFVDATGVLEMIAKHSDEPRLRNERLKAERDERARQPEGSRKRWKKWCWVVLKFPSSSMGLLVSQRMGFLA